MSVVVCGLDVHKDSTYATVLGSDGEKLAQAQMSNEEVPAFLKPYRVDRVAMEASTSIAPLYRRLVEEGYDVIVSHPKKTRYIAEARIKSDRVDSRALAELVRLNSLPESYMPPRDIAELRERVRRRAFLVRERRPRGWPPPGSCSPSAGRCSGTDGHTITLFTLRQSCLLVDTLTRSGRGRSRD